MKQIDGINYINNIKKSVEIIEKIYYFSHLYSNQITFNRAYHGAALNLKRHKINRIKSKGNATESTWNFDFHWPTSGKGRH